MRTCDIADMMVIFTQLSEWLCLPNNSAAKQECSGGRGLDGLVYSLLVYLAN